MKNLWLIPVLLVGAALLARALGSEAGKVDIGERIAKMPDTSPPKWIYMNVTAIRENTDRILALLDGQGRTVTGDRPAPQAPEA